MKAPSHLVALSALGHFMGGSNGLLRNITLMMNYRCFQWYQFGLLHLDFMLSWVLQLSQLCLTGILSSFNPQELRLQPQYAAVLGLFLSTCNRVVLQRLCLWADSCRTASRRGKKTTSPLFQLPGLKSTMATSFGCSTWKRRTKGCIRARLRTAWERRRPLPCCRFTVRAGAADRQCGQRESLWCIEIMQGVAFPWQQRCVFFVSAHLCRFFSSSPARSLC